MVQNGIALTATLHWLFDRHLISLTDEYELLVSAERIPPKFLEIFGQPSKRISLPVRENDWPHPSYIARHRELFYKNS